MGSIYKPRTVRWLDTNNKRVPAGTPGAIIQRKKSETFWAKYRDANGKERRKSLEVKDKGNAKKLLAEIEERAERERVGLVDSSLEQHKRPLSEHLQEWYASLEELDITSRRMKEVPQRMQKLVHLAGWTKLTDIKEDAVRKALNRLEVSLETRNHYLQHLKQFLIWCIPERLQFNPITRIKRSNVAKDRRHDRRHLSDDEIVNLLTVTESSKTIRGKLDGPSRAMLYATALGTGFRRGELQSLTHASIDLEKRIVTVAAAYSKHRKKDVQSIPPWLVERLRPWLAADRPLWPNLTRHTSKMIRADLEDAGIPYEVPGTDGPLYADFHALRHTFATKIGQTDTSLLEMMRVTRHATPALLLRYAKTTDADKEKCVSQMLDPFSKSRADNSSTD